MRAVYPFNDQWLFWADDVGNSLHDDAMERVTLPHTNKLLPHHYFEPSAYGFISTYRKRFTLPEPLNGRRLFLDFEGAMIAATVTINGHEFPEHRGGYTPFSFDITEYIKEGEENLLTVRLDSSERPDIPPFGYVVDYLTFGGIYREASLRYVEPCYIENVFVRTKDVLTNPSVEVYVVLKNTTAHPTTIHLYGELGHANWQRVNASLSIHFEPAVVPAHAEIMLKTSVNSDRLLDIDQWRPNINDYDEELSDARLHLWTLDDPKLYQLCVTIIDPETFDQQRVFETGNYPFVNIGFREARFDKDGNFYLNGQPLQLRGLNRHQTYPYIGAAAPARLQRKDADILKYELGCNIVRTSHYPQSRHFLDRCDEIGLLVFEEIPGWQHIGDADWQQLALRDVEAMIKRDRNHPSIVLWGVRINESPDDAAFYEESNTLAHELDPTRQTGGVRNFLESQFLEDVYTFNDFSNGVREPVHTPHLITEFSGHMYPTKTWDQQERQVEQAVRHARIQNAAAGNPRVAGAIGWCAFDYNTHREFGSGDRICYHGVMDIFRLPKFAAYFYASQIDPAQKIVLNVASHWAFGDPDSDNHDPLYVFSNVERVKVWYGDNLHGTFKPSVDQFPHLPYPPFVIPGLTEPLLFGANFGDLRVVGFIGDQQVAEQRIAAAGMPHALTLAADDAVIKADDTDMTRLTFRIVEKYGNRLPFAHAVVQFHLRGDGADGSPLAQLIGENPFPLVGGQAAVYLKAGNQPGVVTVHAKTLGAFDFEASVTVTLE